MIFDRKEIDNFYNSLICEPASIESYYKDLNHPTELIDYVNDLFSYQISCYYHPNIYILPFNKESDEFIVYLNDVRNISNYGYINQLITFQNEIYQVFIVNND